MNSKAIRLGGVLCLGAAPSVSALAQNLAPTGTAQIQNLQNTAIEKR